MTDLSCAISSCSCRTGHDGRPILVRWQGAQRELLRGDIRGVVDLERLAHLENLYGVGPLEQVKGEVTILDSQPWIARVTADGTLSVENSFANRVCFLVYSQVARWCQVALPEGVLDEKSLEATLPELAARHGLDADCPFPFLLRGRPELAVFHVLNKTDALTHSPELHDKAKVRFSLERVVIEAIGFHSRNHRGIFTPGESNIHIHLVSEDGVVSGHVERLSFGPGIELYLPGTPSPP